MAEGHALGRYDEPREVASRIARVVTVPVNNRRPFLRQEDVIRAVAVVASSELCLLELSMRSLQFLEELF